MKINTDRSGGSFFIHLSGELDHHAARDVIPKISSIIDVELPIRLFLDFKEVYFMDSSGIAVVIGAYKRVRSVDGAFSVINVSKQAMKVFKAAGLCSLIEITESEPAAIEK